jgi:hypothetical protein
MVAGFFGFLVMLLTFASVFAESMKKGAIEFVLTRPISRTSFVLLRYVAATVLVLAFNVGFFALCTLGLALRAGAAPPWFLACAVTPTLLFAVFFPIAMLLGVWTRNANTAALGTVGAWGVAAGVAAAREVPNLLPEEGTFVVLRALDVLELVLPRIESLQALNEVILERAAVGLAPFRASLAHAALHAAAVLALAVWSLRRRDL